MDDRKTFDEHHNLKFEAFIYLLAQCNIKGLPISNNRRYQEATCGGNQSACSVIIYYFGKRKTSNVISLGFQHMHTILIMHFSQ
jgi:hypothetical protein